MKIRIILILVSLFLCLDTYGSHDVKKCINVGIILNVSSFTVGCSKDFIVSSASNKKLRLRKGNIKISYSPRGIRINQYILQFPVKIEPSNGIIFANSKPYRGHLVLRKYGKKIDVINVIAIEDYLRGVLPKEVNCNWHMEALKTQAVISRTYSIANLSRHLDRGFDMCSTTHCQVYGGAGVENDRTDKAVLATQCKVLTFEGELAQTVFHANCGGHTEDPKYVWNWETTPLYLKGVKCDYCKKMPHANWENTLNEHFIREKLSHENIGKIKKIEIKEKTSTGSAKNLKITHSNGKLLLNAYEFRLTIDPWQIKSHYFDSIKKYGDKFHFKGKGWGHKVGLCQCGAKVMADKGKKYKAILFHFYPATSIEKVAYR